MTGGVLLARIADDDGPRIVVASPDARQWYDVRTSERLRLQRRGASVAAASRLARALVPPSLSEALDAGPTFLSAARQAAADADGDATVLGEPPFVRPIDPPAYRDFMAFEEHFVRASAAMGREPADVLYEMPVSYFGNPTAILGPEDVIPWPHYTRQMDYELELGIVVSGAGRDLTPETAMDHVLGLTNFNDFSARDIQALEMTGGLGPSKGKHFGSAVGPWIATLDAVDPNELKMTARVNGEVWSENSSRTMLWSIAELVAWASTAEPLAAGTLIGSGTVGGGCGLEQGRFLAPGDVVEIEISGLGVLRNTLGTPPPDGWRPERRAR
jgi:2-keto-4-pentenoate hydratase/2-oxohepta-3-ene-1,7-dioic acid hydratase in catechol pathway